MITNPNDSALEKRVAAIEDLLRSNPLEDASFGAGGIRVYDGGTIRFTEGGGIVIEGDGYIIIGGDLTGDGTFQWTGPWKFNNGDGEIAGNVAMTGDFDLTGVLTSMNVRIQDGKIYVGLGPVGIILDGATGQITAGDMVIDPSNGGSVSFPGGAIVKAGPSGGVSMTQGNYSAVVTASGASIGKPGLSVSATDANGISFAGVPSSSPGPQYPLGVYYENGLGQLRRASGS